MGLDDSPSHDLSHDRPLSPRPKPPPIDPEQWTRRAYDSERSSVEPDPDYQFSAPQADNLRTARPRHSMPHPRPKRPSMSNKTGMPLNILPSAPASPPTPAPSPTPYQRAPSWNSASADEDSFLRDARPHFSTLNAAERQRYLAELLNMCDSNLLSFVHAFVSPRLKKDPFEHLPDELCLRASSTFAMGDILTDITRFFHTSMTLKA
jgi:hypothetical protein